MQTTDLVTSHKRVSIYICSLASSGCKWEAREDDQGHDAGKGLTTMRLLLADPTGHTLSYEESQHSIHALCLVSVPLRVLCTKESWYIPKTMYTHNSFNDLWKTKFSFLAYSRARKLNIPQKFNFYGRGGSPDYISWYFDQWNDIYTYSHCYTRRWRGERRRRKTR